MRPLRKTRLKRQESRRALEHWRLLYQESQPPPDKEKPAAGNDGPEGKKLREVSSPDSILGEADRQREAEARAAYIRFVLSPERHRLELLNALIRGRSQAMVRLMERERGFA
jgi:hypothetical protein